MRDPRIFASKYWNMSSEQGGAVAVAIVAVWGGMCQWVCPTCEQTFTFAPTSDGSNSMSPHPFTNKPDHEHDLVLTGDWAAYVGGSIRTWNAWMCENDVRSNGDKLDKDVAYYLFNRYVGTGTFGEKLVYRG